MTKEDVEFLKKLQHEMLTQDNACQAAPRFWAVMTTKRIYWVDDDIDGYEVVIESESAGETVKDVISYIKEYYEDYFEEFHDKILACEKHNDTYRLCDILKDDGWDIFRVPYRDIKIVAENTFFLTLEECKKHIEYNKYHYNKPYPYCMTAWRSPQVERLYKILENENWDKFVIGGEEK